MTFAQDRARMRRILAACDAPAEVAATFESICHLRQSGDIDGAEEILLDACRRHNFVAPYQSDDDGQVVFRPSSLDRSAPGFSADIGDGSAAEDQSYRRGLDHGFADAVAMMRAGASLADLEARAKTISLWRAQPVQRLNAWPAEPYPQTLPERWRGI